LRRVIFLQRRRAREVRGGAEGSKLMPGHAPAGMVPSARRSFGSGNRSGPGRRSRAPITGPGDEFHRPRAAYPHRRTGGSGRGVWRRGMPARARGRDPDETGAAGYRGARFRQWLRGWMKTCSCCHRPSACSGGEIGETSGRTGMAVTLGCAKQTTGRTAALVAALSFTTVSPRPKGSPGSFAGPSSTAAFGTSDDPSRLTTAPRASIGDIVAVHSWRETAGIVLIGRGDVWAVGVSMGFPARHVRRRAGEKRARPLLWPRGTASVASSIGNLRKTLWGRANPRSAALCPVRGALLNSLWLIRRPVSRPPLRHGRRLTPPQGKNRPEGRGGPASGQAPLGDCL